MDNISKIEQEISTLKDSLLKEIISSDLSKPEKLHAIARNNLFQMSSSWEEVFYQKYAQAFINKIQSGQEYLNKYAHLNYKPDPCLDDYFVISHYDRHEVVNLADITDNYYFNDPDNQMVTIYTNRTTKDILQIPRQEFVDHIYDWCLENKIVEFELDW